MKTLEHWVLRIADSDATWLGFNWLRPAKSQRLGPGYILGSSVLYGLPGMGVGAGVIYGMLGRVEPRVWWWLFVLVLMLELPLNILFAYFWNRRAGQLAREVPRV